MVSICPVEILRDISRGIGNLGKRGGAASKMTIEKIRTLTGKNTIKNYPFSRDGFAYRCTLCGGIWLKEKESKNHDCKPKD